MYDVVVKPFWQDLNKLKALNYERFFYFTKYAIPNMTENIKHLILLTILRFT